MNGEYKIIHFFSAPWQGGLRTCLGGCAAVKIEIDSAALVTTATAR